MHRTLILHIGHPKTGSTTLQKTLSQSSQGLKKHGVLYADTGDTYNHKWVAMALFHAAAAEMRVKNYRTRDEDFEHVRQHGQRIWECVLQDVRRSDASHIVLSAEMFFEFFGHQEMSIALREFGKISQNIEVVAYLRDPVSHELTGTQQRLRNNPDICLIRPNYFRDSLEPLLSQSNVNLHVHYFHRDGLADGDIVTDFFTKHLPFVPENDLQRQKAEKNTTSSAEAIVLLDKLWRGELHLPGSYQGHVDKLLSNLILRVDPTIKDWVRPTFRPGVGRAIFDRREDIQWTEETFNLVFARPDPTPSITLSEAEMHDVAALYEFSQDRLERLFQAVQHAAISQSRGSTVLRS